MGQHTQNHHVGEDSPSVDDDAKEKLGKLLPTINGLTNSAVNLGQMTAIGAVIVFCLFMLGGGFYFLYLWHRDFQLAIQGAKDSHKILVETFEGTNKELRRDFKETINEERKMFRESVAQMISSDKQQHEENRRVLVAVQDSLSDNRRVMQEVVKLVSAVENKQKNRQPQQ